MERFVRLTAPTGKVDFLLKLIVLLIVGGALNHLRDIITDGFEFADTFFNNFVDASFTAIPMCAFALALIAHLNSLQRRLYLQAMKDPLTGMRNRRWFLDNTPDSLTPNQALMIVDIDHFKTINDRFGHDVGDEALIHAAKHLKSCLNGDAQYARIGGEEFAIFFPQTALEELKSVADKISGGFLFEACETESVQLTSSVGIAFGLAGKSRAAAMKVADEATYDAKSQGRARHVLRSQ